MDGLASDSSLSHGLLTVPDEVILQVVQHLDLTDIISLRKTCLRLCALTQDRSIWLQILELQSRDLPLPYHIEKPSSWFPLPLEEVETVVRRLQVVNHTWLLPRSRYFIPGHQESCVPDPAYKSEDGTRTIYSIEVLLDRWLLCIFHEKLVELWDLDSAVHDPHQPILCTSQTVEGAGSFSSAITHLNEPDNVLTIAVACHERCHVMQVQLHPSTAIHPMAERQVHDVQFCTIAVIAFASPIFSLRAVDPNQSLLLLGLTSSFHLLNWDTRQRTVVNMLSEDEEELWNGVVGATFLTQRHILVLKAHSLEICTLLDSPQARMNEPHHDTNRGSPQPRYTPLAAQMSAAIHSHFFPSTTFRGVSFSRATMHAPPFRSPGTYAEAELTHVSLSFLAYDVLRGLFHCEVIVTIPSVPDPHTPHVVSPPLDVQVRLLAAHNMATPVAPGTDSPHTPTPRSGFSQGARGFVSACALGRSARRGVWVERRRGAVRRVVYGFTTSPGQASGEDETALEDAQKAEEGSNRTRRSKESFQPGTPISVTNSELDPESAHTSWHAHAPHVIEGWEVYEVNSYDLRDDITHIAFSETTGVIALGTRKGDIRVLGRSDRQTGPGHPSD